MPRIAGVNWKASLVQRGEMVDSSAPGLVAEFCCFSLLSASFNDQQDHSLQDYIETSLLKLCFSTKAGIVRVITIIELCMPLTQFLKEIHENNRVLVSE